MRMPGTWGDELTLRAAADLLRAKVYVITSEPENWLLQYDPPPVHPATRKVVVPGGGGSAERCLFVTYISPIHYNTIEHDTSAFTQEKDAAPAAAAATTSGASSAGGPLEAPSEATQRRAAQL